MDAGRSSDRNNYRSLVIAGTGTIGRSLISLGKDQLALFDKVFAVDIDANALTGLRDSGIKSFAGDITEPHFLDRLMDQVPGPSLFVNICSATDNLRIRSNLRRFDSAYLDSCASSTTDPDECRFSRMMPYTYKKIDTRYPHWLCWGINPGLVEIIARRILAGLPNLPGGYDVAIYEFDRLQGKGDNGMAAVGWCPESLVEEVMLSPVMKIIDGKPEEDVTPGARSCRISWDGCLTPAWIVAHEDIWNLSEVPTVRNACFYYSLDPAVMGILSQDNAQKARDRLYIPGDKEAVSGLEQVAVQVSGGRLPVPKTMVWSEDHAGTWHRFGVNAVQYQTAKSLLLAVMLLQRTDYGLVPRSNNAANLPIAPKDWQVLDRFMQELGIDWQDGSHLNLHESEN